MPGHMMIHFTRMFLWFCLYRATWSMVCMLQEVDSSGLVEQGAQLHSILFCGFRASAHSLVNSGIQGNAAAGSPMHELPGHTSQTRAPCKG